MSEHDVLVRRATRMAILNDEMTPGERRVVSNITMGAYTEWKRIEALREFLDHYQLTDAEIEAIERGDRIRT